MHVDRMSRQTTNQVVVVGAGPAGLVAAITLARYGVECLVVERRAESSSLPRATGVSLRTMELLRSWDLEHDARAGGNDVELLLLECETLTRASAGIEHTAGFPSSAQSAVLSPTTPGCIPQDHLESVLREHLRSLPCAHLAVGFELTDIATSADGSRLTLRDVVSDEAQTIDARYVIAADGARSAVRDAFGIGMVGADHLDERVVIQFRAPLWDVVHEHRYVIYSTTHPQAVASLLPAGRDDRWLYGVAWDPCREQLTDYADDRMRDMIAAATGVPSLSPRIERANAFSFAAQIADRFRHDDVFLVGDAAHRISPRGRDLDEHRDRRCVRHRLEARLGHEGLGSPDAARLLRTGTPTARGAQPRPIRRSDGESAAGDLRAVRRPRGPTSPIGGSPPPTVRSRRSI